jgi:hypothetical protein
VFPEPRIAVVPDQVRNAGEQIIRLAVMVGIKLDDAQRYLAEVMSGVGSDGRWSAFEVVIFAPRQNLKSEFCLVRILAGLFLFNEQLIVYSAHRAATTTKLFRRLKRAVDKCPQLGGRIVRVSNRIGAESIELRSGQVVEMCARSTSSGRGYTGDLVIFDESHELDSDELAAILPMVLTRPRPQVLYALSLGNEKTSHVGGLRERALAGKPGVAWVEWSMGPDDQVSDRAVWRRCNPAVAAGRVRMERLESLYEALGEDNFAVEHLGRATWPTGAPGEWLIVGQDEWEACRASVGLFGEPGPNRDHGTDLPSREVDPFALWGPSGVPPWVRRGVITGSVVAR